MALGEDRVPQTPIFAKRRLPDENRFSKTTRLDRFVRNTVPRADKTFRDHRFRRVIAPARFPDSRVRETTTGIFPLRPLVKFPITRHFYDDRYRRGPLQRIGAVAHCVFEFC